MSIALSHALNINELLAPTLDELSEEDLASVYGGDVTPGDGIALGGVIVGAGAALGFPVVAAFGAGFAIGSFLGGYVSGGY